MKSANNKINKSILKHEVLPLILGIVASISLAAHALASPISPKNVLDAVNREREIRNLPDLTINSDLASAASLKSKDMINRNYFEHFAFGITPWDFIKNAGYNYLYAGENLAMDFNTSEGMVRAWMNSPAHRENILNPDFKDTGIGIIKGEYTIDGKVHETTMVTNMFGRKKPAIVKALDYITKDLLGNLF